MTSSNIKIISHSVASVMMKHLVKIVWAHTGGGGSEVDWFSAILGIMKSYTSQYFEFKHWLLIQNAHLVHIFCYSKRSVDQIMT